MKVRTMLEKYIESINQEKVLHIKSVEKLWQIDFLCEVEELYDLVILPYEYLFSSPIIKSSLYKLKEICHKQLILYGPTTKCSDIFATISETAIVEKIEEDGNTILHLDINKIEYDEDGEYDFAISLRPLQVDAYKLLECKTFEELSSELNISVESMEKTFSSINEAYSAIIDEYITNCEELSYEVEIADFVNSLDKDSYLSVRDAIALRSISHSDRKYLICTEKLSDFITKNGLNVHKLFSDEIDFEEFESRQNRVIAKFLGVGLERVENYYCQFLKRNPKQIQKDLKSIKNPQGILDKFKIEENDLLLLGYNTSCIIEECWMGSINVNSKTILEDVLRYVMPYWKLLNYHEMLMIEKAEDKDATVAHGIAALLVDCTSEQSIINDASDDTELLEMFDDLEFKIEMITLCILEYAYQKQELKRKLNKLLKIRNY